jgi:hypothetical protein
LTAYGVVPGAGGFDGALNFLQDETGLGRRVADADDLAVVIGGRLAGLPRVNRKGRKGRRRNGRLSTDSGPGCLMLSSWLKQ